MTEDIFLTDQNKQWTLVYDLGTVVMDSTTEMTADN